MQLSPLHANMRNMDMTASLCAQREDGIYVLHSFERFSARLGNSYESGAHSDIELIQQLRGMNENAINFLTSTLSQRLSNSGVLGGIDAICSIPHRASNIHYRGVRLVAMKIAQILNYQDATVCLARRHTSRMPGLPSFSSMPTTVALAISHPEYIRGKSVLLLDDIVVTGRAIRVAEKVLIEAGAKDVVKIALYGMTVSQYVASRLG